MRKIMIVALCLIMVLSSAACSGTPTEQATPGINVTGIVRPSGYRSVKTFLKTRKGDAAAAKAHYRTHKHFLPLMSDPKCSACTIGQVLYLAVPPIFFLIPGVQSNPCPLTRDADGSDTRFPFPLAAHPVLFVQARLCAFQLPRTLCK